jgi:two-component system LytT family response regulator
MIKAVLIDDEIHCLDILSMLLAEYCPSVEIAEQCSSAKQGLLAIQKHSPGLVFLDIEMPSMNGFDMLEHIPSIGFAIIFTTSYDQYAIRAIHFSALDYLLKPVDPKELMNAVNKVNTRHVLPTMDQFTMMMQMMKSQEQGFRKIAIPTIEGFELLEADQIVRCEANDNYTVLVLKNKNRITACRTLKDIESQLGHYGYFVRVHHSYIVNLNEVVKYVRGEGGYLVMNDGITVNVSRSRKEALLKYF